MSQNTSTPTADTRKFSSLRNGISEFLGNMTGYDSVDINLTGSFRGKIYFQTSKFENDGYTTVHEFTGADLQSHTFTEDDIHSRLLTSEDFAWELSPVIEVILKKKIVKPNPSLYQGAWDALTDTPTLPTPSDANKGYWYRVSVAGNGYVVGDITVSSGTAWERFEIGNYELDDYVKKDGSTPFTAPQKGVDGVDDDDLATVGQLGGTSQPTMPLYGMIYKGEANTTTTTPTGTTNDTYIATEAGTIFGVDSVEIDDYMIYSNGLWFRCKKELFTSSFIVNVSKWYEGDISNFNDNIVHLLSMKCISAIDFEYYTKPDWWDDRIFRLRRINGINSSWVIGNTGGFIALEISTSDTVNGLGTLVFDLDNINTRRLATLDNFSFFIHLNVQVDYMPYSIHASTYSNISSSDGLQILPYIQRSNSYTNENLLEYVKGQEMVCEYYSIPVVDLFRKSGINFNNKDNYVESDLLHPTELCYDFTKKMIMKQIEDHAIDNSLTGKTIGWYGGSFCRNGTQVTGNYTAITSSFVDATLGTISTSYALGGYGFSSNAYGQIYNQVTNSASHDIFIIWCSTNDITNESADIGELKTTNTETQTYGLEKTITDLQALNPNAKIILINTIKAYTYDYLYDTTIIRIDE